MDFEKCSNLHKNAFLAACLMLTCNFSQVGFAETVTNKENGYALTVPEGWERFPEDILRLREQVAEQVLKTRMLYDFGFQAPGKDYWQAPPYIYVTTVRYTSLGLEPQPSVSVLEKLIKETCSPKNLAGVGEALKDGLRLDSTDPLGSEIDSSFDGLHIEYDNEKKQVLQHTKAGDFGTDPLEMWSVSYYGRFATVKIDFFSTEAAAQELTEVRESLFNSFHFLEGFGWPEQEAKGDEHAKEPVVPGTAEDPQYRWPKAFMVTGSREESSDADTGLVFPAQGKDSLENIMSAYAFYQGQRISVASVCEQYPSVAASLNLVQTKFENQFSPAIKHMEAFFEQADATAVIKEEMKKSEDLYGGKTYSEEEAKQAVAQIESRTSGNIPSPILETLLIFHPLYQRFPELEFTHGFTREYLSEGDEKARGLKIAMQIPSSWSSAAGRRPHVLRKFRSLNGQGTSTITITITPFPEDVSAEEFDRVEPWDYAAVMKEGLGTSLDADLELVDAARIRLAGQPGTWMEATGILRQNGAPFSIRMVNFSLRYENNLIAIQCMTSPQLEGQSVEDAYRRMAPLFMRILRTFDIYNRWDN